MAKTMYTPVVPRTKAKKQTLQAFRKRLNKCKMTRLARWDDADAIVRHLIKVQDLMQCVISSGGLLQGQNNLLLFGVLRRSFTSPKLVRLYFNSWSKSHMNYRQSVINFLNKLDELQVTLLAGDTGMLLRSGKELRAPYYERNFVCFPPDLREKVVRTFPRRIRYDDFDPKDV